VASPRPEKAGNIHAQELQRNAKREFGKLLALLQAYALVATGRRIVATNQAGHTLHSSKDQGTVHVVLLTTTRGVMSCSTACQLAQPRHQAGRTTAERVMLGPAAMFNIMGHWSAQQGNRAGFFAWQSKHIGPSLPAQRVAGLDGRWNFPNCPPCGMRDLWASGLGFM
jgi:hypothetical protein